MTLLDASAVSINAYNRNLRIEENEMVSIGESAITSWGLTRRGDDIEDELIGAAKDLPMGMGIDGTSGDQPRGNQIVSNLIHEIGIYQKQSSMYFQGTFTSLFVYIFFLSRHTHLNSSKLPNEHLEQHFLQRTSCAHQLQRSIRRWEYCAKESHFQCG